MPRLIKGTGRCALVPAVLLVALSQAAAAADELSAPRFTAEAVFELAWAADPQVAPDGERIAYVRNAYERRADRARSSIWLLERQRDEHRPLITGDGSYSHPRFSPQGDRLLYVASEGGRASLRVRYLQDGADFSVAELFQAPRQAVWSPDGRQIAFAMFVKGEPVSFAKPPKAPEQAAWADPVKVTDDLPYRFDGRGWLDKGATQVFVVAATGGVPRAVTAGESDYGAPAWLSAQQLVVVGNDNEDPELDPIERDLFVIDLERGTQRALTERDGPDTDPVVSPDGRRIAYLGFDDRRLSWQQTELYVMDADGGGVRNLTAELDRTVSAPQWTPDGRHLLVLSPDQGDHRLLRIALDGRVTELARDVGGTSLGRPYASGQFSVGGTARAPQIAYTRSNSQRPADVALLDHRGRLRQLTDLNADGLGRRALARIEKITVPSSHDERPIDAWIAYPPGHQANGQAPLLLEIHGGPFAMYGPSFAAEIQRYAAEGYVTVYANPRGSTGYGEAFAQLIDLNYPGEDFDDLISVVDAVIARGDVDPQRLFVTGGSGGGVLTAWIVGSTDRFAAAATVKPVINWTTMALAGDIAAFVGRHWMRAQPWENPERYWKLSPLSRAGKVNTPTLVMVGEEDWRTPTFEAEQFYGALKLRKVPTALVRVPGAAHHIAARPSHLIAKVDNIMGWFARHDPAQAKAAEHATGAGP